MPHPVDPAPVVARLFLYPIKSLDPVEVARAELMPEAGLRHDRAFALFDPTGAVVTGKRHPAVHRLRARYDLDARRIDLADESGRRLGRASFDVVAERAGLERWLGAFFGFPVALRHDPVTGFPDDLVSPGPTLVSVATLAAIADWFGRSVDDIRARLRANIELSGVPAFWEDRLFAPNDAGVRFDIGSAALVGVNPCARCAVPTRDPWTGEVDPGFAARFVDRRRTTLPDWAPREPFDHYYRAAVNTRRAGGGADEIVTGAAVKLADAA